MAKGFFSNHPIFILDQNTDDIIDVNNCAIETYGLSKQRLCDMNIKDLGVKKRRPELIPPKADDDEAADKIWIHKKKSGDEFYVQFTTHLFNYNGRRALIAVVHDVSKQVKKREKNVDKFPKIRPLSGVQTLAEIIWSYDKTVLQWSEKAEDLFGWREDEVVGKEGFFERFVHEDEHKTAFDKIDNAFNNLKTSYQIDGRIVDKDGNIRMCEWNNSIAYDEEGNVVAVYSLVQDITERKKSEILFQALSEKSIVGVYLLQDNIFKYVNPRFCEIFSYARDEMENKLGPIHLTHSEDWPGLLKKIKPLLDGTKEENEHSFRAVTKGKKIVHVVAYGRRIDFFGKPAVIGTLLDNTQTKLATQRFKTSVESFENLFDSISDAVHIMDEDGRFLKVNNAAVALYGYDRKELIGQTPEIVLAPGKNDLDEADKYFRKAMSGEPQEFSLWAKRKNGEVFPKQVSAAPGHYLDKDVIILISRDESERFETERRVKQSEKQFWQLFKNAPLGIVMMDRTQDIRIANPAFEHMFGYENQELKGLDLDRLIVPEEDYLKAAEISKSVYAGGISAVRTKRKRKDGSIIDVLIYGVPVKLKEEIIAIFGIYVDISDRMKDQERIEKSLKEKEVMLAEIHHRVKNNLAVITGLLELQQYKTELKPAKHILRESQLRINSIALIHEKLYQNEDLSQVSIDVYIKELIEIIAQSMQSEDEDISLKLKADSTFLTINQAIPCGLILNELVTNAYKHAFTGKEKGTITIILNSEGKEFHLEFEDDGNGIPDTVDFENPESLGMTLIQTLSKQLNGEFNFENKGIGTRFWLKFEIE